MGRAHRAGLGGGVPFPGASSPRSAWLPGLDAQLVIRPLMEKVQRKGYEAVLRKVTFPHVSGVLSGVLRQLPGARGRLCGSSGALRGPLPGPGARRLPRWGWELASLSCWSCWGSLSGLLSHGT